MPDASHTLPRLEGSRSPGGARTSAGQPPAPTPRGGRRPQTVSGRRALLWLFLPLAASTSVRALILPALDAGVARTGDTQGLASYAIAASLADLASAAPFMLQHAYLALVHGSHSYAMLRRFTWLVCAVSTASLVLALLPGFRDVVMDRLLSAPPELRDRSILALAIMLPIPGLATWRFFRLGLLVDRGRPGDVLWTAVLAVALSAGFAVVAPGLPVPAELLGATAYLAIAVAEWAALGVLARRAVAAMPYVPEAEGVEVMGLRRMAAYYWPLAASQIVVGLVRPSVNAALLRLPDPTISVAGFRLASSLLMLFQQVLMPLRPVILVAARSPGGTTAARDVSFGTGFVMAALMVFLGTSPAGAWLLSGLMGAPSGVAGPAQLALVWMAVVPFALGVRQFHSGILLVVGRTGAVGWAAGLRLAGMLGVLVVGTALLDWPGAAIGGAAMAAGFSAEAACSWWQAHAATRTSAPRGTTSEAPTPREPG